MVCSSMSLWNRSRFAVHKTDHGKGSLGVKSEQCVYVSVTCNDWHVCIVPRTHAASMHTTASARCCIARCRVQSVCCWSLCVFARSDLPYTAPYDQPSQCSCSECESVFTSQHVSRRIACAHMFPCHGTSCLSWSGLCLHAIVKTLTMVRFWNT